MASIKLIVTDLDGTFLTDVYTPHPENVRAMRACQEAGIPVCALTGRNWTECKKIVLGANFDRFCGINNGTAIMDTRAQDLRYRNRFHPSVVLDLIRLALSLKEARFCVTGTYQTYQLKDRQVSSFYGPTEAYMDDESILPVAFYDTIEELAENCRADAQRLFLELPYSDAALRKKIYARVNDIVPADITSSGDGGLDVMPQGASKIDALNVLADIYNVRMQNVMAFGDSINDLTMLKAAGVGVAMANGDPVLKKQADQIAPSNTEGGFAKVIWQSVL